MIFTLEIRPPGDGPPDDVTVTPIPNEEHATRYIISISQERREKWAQKMEKEGWGPASCITGAQVLMGFRDAFLGLAGVPPVGPASAEQAEAWMLTEAEVRRHQRTRPATTNEGRAAQ